MSADVIAQVILFTRDGRSILETESAILSEDTARYQVEDEVFKEAKRMFTNYGFQIGPAGPYGFQISGNQDLFERIFRAKLKSTVKQDEFVQSEFYEASEPIRIPEDLSGLVAGVTLPTPPELYA